MPRRAPVRPAYREAYAALSRIAAELEDGDTDLDRVLPLIEEARVAYAVCRERIEALRLALGEDRLAGEAREELEAGASLGEPDEEDRQDDPEDEADDPY